MVGENNLFLTICPAIGWTR